jgi:hypothetical protein
MFGPGTVDTRQAYHLPSQVHQGPHVRTRYCRHSPSSPPTWPGSPGPTCSDQVRRGSVWCGVAQYGAAWLSMVRRGSVWCGVAQLIARQLAGRQARVRFPARHHREVIPTEPQAMRRWREASANVLYECDWMIVLYECYKIYI